MTNQDFIKAYKSDSKIISDYYKFKDKFGKLHNIDGIINPLKIDNRQLLSPTDNQKDTGHCAAYSAATIIESIYWKMTGKLKQLDSHQVYALAKQLDGKIDMEGTYLEYAMQSVLKLCKPDPEFSFLQTAEVKTFFNDKTNKTIDLVKQLLHKYSFLQAGFICYDGWMACNNSNFTISCTGRNLGGHAVVISYYDEDCIGITNQWGVGWGAKGSALMKWKDFLDTFMYGVYLSGIRY